MHGAQKVKNVSQYSCAFYRTLFSEYPCNSMEYAVQENHRHMNFLTSAKIIWIFAESVFCIFVIMFRIIPAQEIQYDEVKITTCTVMNKRNNTPGVLASFWKLKLNCEF